MSYPEKNTEPTQPQGIFSTTRWSLVVRAGGEGRSAQDALSELFRSYWKPLYLFARRSGLTLEDAEDVTQGFIAGLLDSGSLARADQERGRFRTFLLGAFGHYLANYRRGQQALKRGGHFTRLEAAEAEVALETASPDWMTPERMYERQWAQALLDKVMARLREEFENAGRAAVFAALQPHLSGGAGRPGYAALGATLGLSENAVTVTLHRMRKRYGLLLREEIAATVIDESEVDDELRYLMQVVSGVSASSV